MFFEHSLLFVLQLIHAYSILAICVHIIVSTHLQSHPRGASLRDTAVVHAIIIVNFTVFYSVINFKYLSDMQISNIFLTHKTSVKNFIFFTNF